jgi:hypothetical protein
MDTISVSVELPRSALSALRQDPSNFVHEMRLAAAVKWYEMRLISVESGPSRRSIQSGISDSPVAL